MYYIMDKLAWVVKADKKTNPKYVGAYDRVFIGEDVAMYYLNMPAMSKEKISNVLNSIENTDLRSNVAGALNYIGSRWDNHAITKISIESDDTCIIVYDVLYKASRIDTINK